MQSTLLALHENLTQSHFEVAKANKYRVFICPTTCVSLFNDEKPLLSQLNDRHEFCCKSTVISICNATEFLTQMFTGGMALNSGSHIKTWGQISELWFANYCKLSEFFALLIVLRLPLNKTYFTLRKLCFPDPFVSCILQRRSKWMWVNLYSFIFNKL